MQSETTGVAGGTVATDETDRLIASDKVEGTAVYNRAGDRLGTVYNFMVDKYSGQVAYAVMSGRTGSTTVAATFAPSTKGAPTLSAVAKTSNSTDAPTSSFIEGTRKLAPFSTRNCLPPVLMIANMAVSRAFAAALGSPIGCVFLPDRPRVFLRKANGAESPRRAGTIEMSPPVSRRNPLS